MNNVKNRKSLAVILSVVVVLCMAIGGTLAWLIDATEPVVNTFTYGDIDLGLDETLTDEKGIPVDKDGNPIPEGGTPVKTTEGNEYEMLPGEDYLKDPAIEVKAGNEACWLFVKLTETGEVKDANNAVLYDFDDYLKYDIAEGWNALKVDDHEVVYYRYVGEDTDNQGVKYDVLKDNRIYVKETVTKDMLNALDNNGENTTNPVVPELIIKGYAIQYSGFDVEDFDDKAAVAEAATNAWAKIEAQENANN